MGSTIIEKILTRASGKTVKVDDRVWASLDLVTMRDFGGPNVILDYENAFGEEPLFDPNRVAITFDLHVPPRDEKVAQNHKLCRDFAAKKGCKLFDVNQGIGQHVLFEHGLVKPWDVIIGSDSHMNLLGVFGAFATGVGTTDIVAGLKYGKLWYRVPPTIKVVVSGKLKEFVGAKDIILYILKNLKTDGAIYRAIEFTGDIIEQMGLAGRITITSMVTELSGKVGFIEPSQEILDFIKEMSNMNINPIHADLDADYEKIFEFDISNLEPQIACPHSPDEVRPVKEVEGTPIDQVFIGSCTNGRYEDLLEAAHILKGKKAKVRLIIVPATMGVAIEALNNGLYEIFLKVGAMLPNPGCSLCTTGHPGILAPGEVMVSTSNRNFIGKLGKGSEVYLCSPAVAAASAIIGKITDPRKL
ncbi:MAG: aconitase/3-isopropylmalate dehydratase large subunit family protein [bacterium]|nr:aconitase/3-isopropylmalate dehydratase large subunit family protein [bacterium]